MLTSYAPANFAGAFFLG